MYRVIYGHNFEFIMRKIYNECLSIKQIQPAQPFAVQTQPDPIKIKSE